MSFTLHERLETEVEIEGEIYEVNMAFDNIIVFFEMMDNPNLSDTERVYYGIHMLLGTHLDLEAEKQIKVFETLIKSFVHGGEKQELPVDLEGNVMPVVPGEKAYDLVHDATYIYTSFKQAYDMDLFEEQGKLDWRKFKMLLRDLPNKTKLKEVVDIRLRPYPKGKGMGEERKKLKELKRHYALPGVEIDD